MTIFRVDDFSTMGANRFSKNNPGWTLIPPWTAIREVRVEPFLCLYFPTNTHYISSMQRLCDTPRKHDNYLLVTFSHLDGVRSLVRQVVGPTGRWSERSLVYTWPTINIYLYIFIYIYNRGGIIVDGISGWGGVWNNRV